MRPDAPLSTAGSRLRSVRHRDLPPSWDEGEGERAGHAGGRRRAGHRRGVRGPAVVGAGAAGAADTGRRRPRGGRRAGAHHGAGHRAAPDRGVPAGVLRAAVGGRRRERVRHPQRRAGGMADRRHARPGATVPGGGRDAPRPVHGAPRGLPARPGHQRRGADRPRGGARRRLAQGRRRLATPPRAGVRERSREPRTHRGRGQPGQERCRCRHLDAAQHRLPLRVRGAADPGQDDLRAGRHERGARGARGGARAVPTRTRSSAAVRPAG